MTSELLTILGGLLGGIKSLGRVTSGLANEVSRIQRVIYAIKDEKRKQDELECIRTLCGRVQYLTWSKGDLAYWLDQYEKEPEIFDDGWESILWNFENLGHDLEQLEKDIAKSLFCNTSLANELLIEINRNKGILNQYAKMPEPQAKEEFDVLRNIGKEVREIQEHGTAALKRVDDYVKRRRKS